MGLHFRVRSLIFFIMLEHIKKIFLPNNGIQPNSPLQKFFLKKFKKGLTNEL